MAEKQKTAGMPPAKHTTKPTKPTKTAKTANEASRRRTATNGRTATVGKADVAEQRQLFAPVVAPTKVDYPLLEERVQRWWDEHDILQKYLHKNDGSPNRWSFIDGPMTANNPMGVHHAWGRTYKDLWQRFNTMRGYRQRYQNGWDAQGLHVEVEVEKELGFNNKRDIEVYGVANFVEKCKERVLRFAALATDQSVRLGEWMDWPDSYYTMSDENNYTIWGFLKRCWQEGWIYKGTDVMPWCPRCGTGISDMEINEGRKEV
ncbi:MAG TPA: class I tRNA ligase family protein, partial [Ktedonobacterales bacterium]|nr:class I tRNA ligase family protein [Ktedonobacterales bacterium]